MKIKDIWIQGILFPLLYSRFTLSLECWQCIGEDCHLHPEEVERAEKKQCREDESCLKVYYKVKDAGKGNEELIKESVTRSCSAGICDSRNDLVNCSHDQLENPGCTRRFCCNDADFCNAAGSLAISYPSIILLTSAVILRTIYSWIYRCNGRISYIPQHVS